MANNCSICLQPLLQLVKGQKDTNQACGDASQLRRVIATKCGHVFHADCLKSKFAQKSSKAWNPQKCPLNTCSTMINVTIDTFVIHANQMDKSGMIMRDEAEAVAAERLRFYEEDNKKLMETCNNLRKQHMDSRAYVENLEIKIYQLQRCLDVERQYSTELEQKVNDMLAQKRRQSQSCNIDSMQYASPPMHVNGQNGIRRMHDAPQLLPQNPNSYRARIGEPNLPPPPGFEALHGKEFPKYQVPVSTTFPTRGHRNPRFEKCDMIPVIPKLNPAYGQDMWNEVDRSGENANEMNIKMNQHPSQPLAPTGQKNEQKQTPLAQQGQQILRMIQQQDSVNEISFKPLMRDSAEMEVLPLSNRQFKRSNEQGLEPEIKEPLFRALYGQPYQGLGKNNRSRNTVSPDDNFMHSLLPPSSTENDITKKIQNCSLNLTKPSTSPEDNRSSPDRNQKPRSSTSSEFALTWTSDSETSSGDEQKVNNGMYGEKKKVTGYVNESGNRKASHFGSGNSDTTRRPFPTTYGRFHCKKCKADWGAKIQPEQKLVCRYCNTLTKAYKEEEFKKRDELGTGKLKEKRRN